MSNTPLNICIAGAHGKMGSAIQNVIRANPEKYHLLGCIRKAPNEDSNLLTLTNLNQFPKKPDLVVDFTRPEFSLEVALQAQQSNIPLVSGTTGFDQNQFNSFKSIAENIPVVWSANMSVGVNLAMALAKISAAVLGDAASIEIIETHHTQKQDAPSGTAIAIGKEIAAAKHQCFADLISFDENHWVKQHPSDKIGFNVFREDEVIGDHQVKFMLESEQLNISHHAQNRKLFATGALKAVEWIQQKPPGFYSMSDVLGIQKIIKEVI